MCQIPLHKLNTNNTTIVIMASMAKADKKQPIFIHTP